MNPKTLLDQHEIQPRKSLGQNFLHDPGTLQKIVEVAQVTPQDTVLEIGPGTGALTELLAQSAKKVVAVEVDERLKPILESNLAAFSNVEVVYQDILEANIAALVGDEPFIVVANLPYYITSAIIRQLLELPKRPKRLTLTVQLEVAERITAKPGDMSILAVSVQFYGRPQLAARLKAGSFWPRPEVDSAVIRIDAYDTLPVDVPDETLFFRMVRAGFSQKRKQLKNSLQSGLHLAKESADSLFTRANIDPRRRAETLTLEEWAALTRAFAEAS
jgi:16S rRNA (adenine1518-N6/adenine1519-N6)-dimethyltransferase